MQWHDCMACELGENRNNIVFGNGRPDADVLFIGEGPGADEDLTGDPFVGESGKVLNSMLEALDVPRESVFVTNLVMCRPPDNRDPIKVEREACLARLHAQIYLVDPLLIIPVGKLAMKSLMGNQWQAITKLHGKIGEVKIPGQLDHVRVDADKGIVYQAMPIYHPAYVLRMDTIDKTTGAWRVGGEGEETFEDLRMAFEVVKYMKEAYRNAHGRRRGNAQTRLKVVK
jgi:DNA polymerase